MVAPLLIPIALEIAKRAAPGLVKTLTGSDRAADVAGKLVGLAQEVTGTATPDAALDKLADPNMVMRLRQRTLELETEETKAYLEDRQDARKMETRMAELGLHSGRKDVMIFIDAAGLILSLVSLVGIGYMKANYPDAISDAVFGALMTQLTTFASYFGLCLRDAHQFEFGSSRGSERKDIMAKQVLADQNKL